MNVENINIGDEVFTEGWFPVAVGWLTVTHIQGTLVIGSADGGEGWAVRANYVTEARRPKTPLGYDPVLHNTPTFRSRDVKAVLADLDTTHVVTHWSDGTCTLDAIAAFREAHAASQAVAS